MSTYTIRRAVATPEFTGAWDGPAWSRAETLHVAAVHSKSSGHHPDVAAKLLYDTDGLYVHFKVQDRYVRSVGIHPLDPVYQDSCVEFFIQPKPDAGYLNFEANCGGTFLVSYIEDCRRVPGGFAKFRPLAPEWFEKIHCWHSLPAVVEPEITEPVAWQREYFIPFALLEAHVGPLGDIAGQTWRGNFYKGADNSSHPHWAAWAPIGEELNFHQPRYFGEIRFGG